MVGPVYSFGIFKLDVGARILFKSGHPVEIGTRSFEVLRLMVENAGQVVGKERLLAEIWKGVHVSQNSVDKQISLIRKIVGDAPEGRAYIETVPGEGDLTPGLGPTIG